MNKERNKTIYQMRESGLSYAKIGKHFGITAARVSQIVEKQQRLSERYTRMQADGIESLDDAFSMRTINALKNVGCRYTSDVKDMYEDNWNELYKLPNIGRKCVLEIMHYFGVIPKEFKKQETISRGVINAIALLQRNGYTVTPPART